jgi:hypothetical protein
LRVRVYYIPGDLMVGGEDGVATIGFGDWSFCGQAGWEGLVEDVVVSW